MDACVCVCEFARATLNEGVINECVARKLPFQHLFFAFACNTVTADGVCTIYV